MQLFVDNLTNSDFCFMHPSRGLLGETWLSHIQLEGSLDEQGMICDFGIVKASVRKLLDDEIDHRLLVPGQSKQLVVDRNHANEQRITWTLEDGQHIVHIAPDLAVTIIDAETITADSVARWCEIRLREILPDTVKSIAVRFTTEDILGPYYHYAHGLKKHRGKCQRIAHGHRSKIEIYEGEARAHEAENIWADRFRDIFIGTREDLVTAEADATQWLFRYQAPEGRFELSLPRSHCYLIDTESTVENIASHIAQQLSEEFPERDYRVRAYEGIAKGAVVNTDE